MELERRLIVENDSYRSPQEIVPKGIIIYSSGFPVDRASMLRVYNRTHYEASVHALIDCQGVTQTLPLNMKGWHSGTALGNTEYLGVMVCEPNPKHSRCSTLRDLTRSNLVQYLVFLCRYWAWEPMNLSSFIQLAGTAHENHLVTSEMLKGYLENQPYFGRIVDDSGEPAYACCDEGSILTEVKQILEQLPLLYREIPHPVETPLTQMGIGDVVLFTGGDLFKSRGISTRQTFFNRMLHGVVTDYSPGSRHAYEVAFPGGPTSWVNKSALVRSTLGHVSL